MLKRLIGDKKGQDLSITTLVLIVLGVVVLVVVALGVTQGWDAVFGVFKQGPGDLEYRVQACNLAGQQDLRATYCDDFKEIKLSSGEEVYVNCVFSQIQTNLDSQNRNKFEGCLGSEETFCDGLVSSGTLEAGDEVKINSMFCTQNSVLVPPKGVLSSTSIK